LLVVIENMTTVCCFFVENQRFVMENAFYVVARELGAENPSIPAWANRNEDPVKLAGEHPLVVTKEMIEQVPGTFLLLNVLTPQECQRFIDISESLAFSPDAAVSLPRSVRHNDSLTWIVDEQTDGLIWQRCAHLFENKQPLHGNRKAVGINARFRFYRYTQGDFFKPHTDGAWPGSRVIDGQLVNNAYADRYSEMTFLLFLSDDYEGGQTQFWVNKDNPEIPARGAANADLINVSTPAGSVLCFPHGRHPLHCLHSGEPVTSGVKYIIRSDMLFLQ
jgi:predicted 2-oxoglutarate/Fe(II)-dependent dioxygenase YbiX